MKRLLPYGYITFFYIIVLIVSLFLLVWFHTPQRKITKYPTQSITFDQKNPYNYTLKSATSKKTIQDKIQGKYLPPELLKITELKGNVTYPKFQRTGRGDIFDFGIYLFAIASGKETKIVNFPSNEGEATNLHWSKDGNYLAWIRQDTPEYFSSQHLEKGIKKVSLGVPEHAVFLSFLPSHERLAVVSSENLFMDTQYPYDQLSLKIINLDDNTLRASFLLNNASVAGEKFDKTIHWIDTNKFIFLTKSGKEFECLLVDISDGSIHSKKLFTTNSAIYSYDYFNNAIVYTLYSDNKESTAKIFQYDFLSGDTRELPNLGVSENAPIWQVQFSSDGRKLVYNWGSGGLTVDSLYDFSISRGTPLHFGAYNYQLSPDNKYIVGFTGYNAYPLEVHGIENNITQKVSIERAYLGDPVWYPLTP